MRGLGAMASYYQDVVPEFAPLVIVGAFEDVKHLSDLPRSGRIVPEFGDGSIRKLTYRHDRIISVVIADTAEILTAYHSAHPLT